MTGAVGKAGFDGTPGSDGKTEGMDGETEGMDGAIGLVILPGLTLFVGAFPEITGDRGLPVRPMPAEVGAGVVGVAAAGDAEGVVDDPAAIDGTDGMRPLIGAVGVVGVSGTVPLMTGDNGLPVRPTPPEDVLGNPDARAMSVSVDPLDQYVARFQAFTRHAGRDGIKQSGRLGLLAGWQFTDCLGRRRRRDGLHGCYRLFPLWRLDGWQYQRRSGRHAGTGRQHQE